MMTTNSNEVEHLYGGHLRVRACGFCVENNQILLLNHQGLTPDNVFWSVPGGGVQFGETLEESLKREFLEETGLLVLVDRLLFVHEFMQPPLHAIELFFLVKKIGGQFTLGTDPEMSAENQVITKMQWMSWRKIKQLKKENVHSVFGNFKKMDDIYESNYFAFQPK